MEPIRRAALIDATIAEIGARRSLDVTVGQIARRAGVSSGLAHHYFGGKDDILIAAMRHILREYTRETCDRLRAAQSHWGRVEAIAEASFAPSNFRPDVISAWLNFYVLSLSSDEAARLYRVYVGRLRSNLIHALRGAAGDRPLSGCPIEELADRAAQMIDGAYLRHGLSTDGPDGKRAVKDVLAVIRSAFGE